jgi:outer membrane protein
MKVFGVSLALGAVVTLAPSIALAQTAPTPMPTEGQRFAVINIQRIAAESTEGKASTAKVQALNQKKIGELNELNKRLQSDQQKLSAQGSMLNEAARADLERNIDREQKDLQRAQQDAQEEVQQLQQDLQNAFQAKLLPIIQQVVSERKITILFSQADAGIVFADPGLDLTADVIKRFDSAAPTTTAAPAPTGTPSTPGAQPAPAQPAPAKPTLPPTPTPKPKQE